MHLGSSVPSIITGTEPKGNETEVPWFLVLKRTEQFLFFRNRTSKMHKKIAYLIANFDNILPYLKENNVQWAECTTYYKEFKGKQATITNNSVIHTHNRLQINRLMG